VSLFELGVRMDNVIVLAYDNKTATSMSSAGFTVAFDPHIQEVAETIKKQSGCQPMWFHAMFQRQMLWNELIDIGVTFWHTDADTAYYRDPTEDLRSGAVHVRYTGEKTDMTADVSSGWVHPFEKLANGSFQTWHINNGVGGVAPLATPNLRDLWLGWYRDRCLSNVCKDGWAAIEMNLWLHEKGLHVVADTSTTLEGDLVGLFADEVKLSVFQPRTKYLYGDPAEPYLVHACGITDPYDKEQHLKFYYGWFVLDMFLEDAIHRLASGTQQDFVTPLHLIWRIRVQPRNDLTMIQGESTSHLIQPHAIVWSFENRSSGLALPYDIYSYFEYYQGDELRFYVDDELYAVCEEPLGTIQVQFGRSNPAQPDVRYGPSQRDTRTTRGGSSRTISLTTFKNFGLDSTSPFQVRASGLGYHSRDK